MSEERLQNLYPSTKVVESIQTIFDLTARIDERVHLMMQQQKELEKKIDNQLVSFNELNIRVRMVESKNGDHISEEVTKFKEKLHNFEMKIQKLEGNSEGQENRWKTIFNFGLQLVWVILAAWLLFKLGIQAPAVP